MFSHSVHTVSRRTTKSTFLKSHFDLSRSQAYIELISSVSWLVLFLAFVTFSSWSPFPHKDLSSSDIINRYKFQPITIFVSLRLDKSPCLDQSTCCTCHQLFMLCVQLLPWLTLCCFSFFYTIDTHSELRL